MIRRSESVLPLMVMATILYAGVVVSMGNLYHSLAVIPTTKSMIRCDALSMLSRRFSSSDYHSPNFDNRLHYGCVIDSSFDVSILRQISQTKIWDPGLSIVELGDGVVKSRSDHINSMCRSTQEACVDRHKSIAETINTIGVFFYSALVVAMGDFLFWVAMLFVKAMGMFSHLQEGVRRRRNTSSRFSFLFQREADGLTTTSKSRHQLKVMRKAFWSLSYMLLAINLKYMKGGSIRHSLIARKAYVQQAGLTHSIIEATASHICENRLYPFSLSLLYERICVLIIVYSNDVLLCY